MSRCGECALRMMCEGHVQGCESFTPISKEEPPKVKEGQDCGLCVFFVGCESAMHYAYHGGWCDLYREEGKAWFMMGVSIPGGGGGYIASRIIDPTKPISNENVEHYGEYSADLAQVEKTVKELNAAEVEKEVERFNERRAKGKKV